MESNSSKQTLLYIQERERKLSQDAEFRPHEPHAIPAAVLDTTLYSRLLEDEKNRREEVKEKRHEMLLSMERPFEGELLSQITILFYILNMRV